MCRGRQRWRFGPAALLPPFACSGSQLLVVKFLDMLSWVSSKPSTRLHYCTQLRPRCSAACLHEVAQQQHGVVGDPALVCKDRGGRMQRVSLPSGCATVLVRHICLPLWWVGCQPRSLQRSCPVPLVLPHKHLVLPYKPLWPAHQACGTPPLQSGLPRALCPPASCSCLWQALGQSGSLSVGARGGKGSSCDQ